MVEWLEFFSWDVEIGTDEFLIIVEIDGVSVEDEVVGEDFGFLICDEVEFVGLE